MKEIWKDIRGYENRYQVSNFGRVKSLYYQYISGKYKQTLRVKPEYMMSQTTNVYGYKRIGLTKNGIQKNYSVHRLVAQEFISNPMNLPQVNHLNGIKSDNRVENLEWVTEKENVIHSFRVLGHKPSYGRRKINNNIIRKIKTDLLNGMSGTDVSKKYKLSPGNISLIKNNKIWEHITI